MKKVLTVLGFIGFLALLAGFGLAQEEGVEVAKGLGAGLIAIGAGLAIGLPAIAAGIAQAGIGSAGAGTLAERPEAFGNILILLVIPETIVIFGFVIAFFLNGKI